MASSHYSQRSSAPCVGLGGDLQLGKERRAASREARIARGMAATKPMKLDGAQQKRLLHLYREGEPVSELTTMFGISRSTLFRTLRVLKKQEPLSE